MDRKELLTTPAAVLRARRTTVFEALGTDALVLPAAPVQFSSRDTDRPYRADSELFYLTGATEPGSVAVFLGGAEPSWILFVPPRDPEAELWAGPRLGPEGAKERFAPDECWPAGELERRLPGLLAGVERIHFRLGTDGRVERLVTAAIEHARTRGARTGTGPRAVVEPGGILDELRLRKDEHEARLIRAAAALTLEGHRAAARAALPGAGEWVVQAELEAVLTRAGGVPGFGTIVGSGPNACVLHYRANDARIPEDALVLVDAGAELGLYNGDVTRTYPASGRFTPVQRTVYALVEDARRAAVAAVRPGVTVAAIHDAASRVLVDGLLALGVLDGSIESVLKQAAHKPFYPHQTSHWLGIDVHDPGDYARNGASRVLEPGMVLTVEPGLYFRPDVVGAAAPFAGIGVRIEDDILVTEVGHENLTEALPTDPDALEAWIASVR